MGTHKQASRPSPTAALAGFREPPVETVLVGTEEDPLLIAPLRSASRALAKGKPLLSAPA
jgi:hypothetical protein